MRLVIHVGHSKTGSSFMQSNLALNSDYLATQGVFYPVSSESEKDLRISSGNGHLLETSA